MLIGNCLGEPASYEMHFVVVASKVSIVVRTDGNSIIVVGASHQADEPNVGGLCLAAELFSSVESNVMTKGLEKFSRGQHGLNMSGAGNCANQNVTQWHLHAGRRRRAQA
jgi:hypothetical protein